MRCKMTHDRKRIALDLFSFGQELLLVRLPCQFETYIELELSNCMYFYFFFFRSTGDGTIFAYLSRSHTIFPSTYSNSAIWMEAR